MHKLISVYTVCLLISATSCKSQLSEDYFVVSPPTIEQEASSIWRTINDIEFLEGQGYRINLPQNELIDELIQKSKNGAFGNDDFPRIYNLLETEIYNEANYSQALEKVKVQQALINTMIKQLYATKPSWNWDFKTFDTYDVVFTLYGTGGSYDPDQGRVTLFTTTKGDFMNYENPSNTIIHEIVHMGVEASIIQEYQVSHGLKERIVDRLVYLLFGDLLPNYKIQNMGDERLDQWLQTHEDIRNLSAIVEQFE